MPWNRSQKNLLFVQPLNFMKSPDWPQNSWQRTIFSVVLQALPCWNGIYMLSKQLESMLRKLQRIACLTVTQQSGRISEDRSTEKMWQWATVFGLGKLSPVGMMKFATPRVGNSDPTVLAWDTTHNWFGERHWELAVAWVKTKEWLCATMIRLEMRRESTSRKLQPLCQVIMALKGRNAVVRSLKGSVLREKERLLMLSFVVF